MCADILRSFHDDPTSGHMGFNKTYARIRQRYFWPQLQTTVFKCVQSCLKCQHIKRPTTAPAGLLQVQPLVCPSAPFERVGIDLFGPFPVSSHGHRWIVTAVDHLTRYAETAALTSATSEEIAQFFVHTILLRHGAPQVLLSDRGRQFLSSTLTAILKACNVIHKTTS